MEIGYNLDSYNCNQMLMLAECSLFYLCNMFLNINV
jgi:hypothetical protein